MDRELHTDTGKRVVVAYDGYDRIRDKTPAHINERIDELTARRIEAYLDENKRVISKRIHELEHEWDIDRVAMLLSAGVISLGLFLGANRSRRWLALIGLEIPAMIVHSVTGFSASVAILRRYGFRSRDEINAERYALKTIRGDFEPRVIH